MNEQEIKSWIAGNIECFSNEQDARDYLIKRQAQKEAKASRVLKFFVTSIAYHEYAETHNVGEYWAYDEDEHEGVGDEYKDFVAVCAYEYQNPKP